MFKVKKTTSALLIYVVFIKRFTLYVARFATSTQWQSNIDI